MRSRTWHILYLAAVGVFAVGILAQVYFVGLSLLGDRPSWQSHIDLGHTLGGAALLMVIFAYAGRLSRPMKLLTWSGFGLYVLLADIVIFMKDSAPMAAALHPVLAALLFAVITTLAVRAWQLVRAPQRQSEDPAEQPAITSAVR